MTLVALFIFGFVKGRFTGTETTEKCAANCFDWKRRGRCSIWHREVDRRPRWLAVVLDGLNNGSEGDGRLQWVEQAGKGGKDVSVSRTGWKGGKRIYGRLNPLTRARPPLRFTCTNLRFLYGDSAGARLVVTMAGSVSVLQLTTLRASCWD